MNITMYMVTHKPVDCVPLGRTPIFVGNGENTNGFLQDNTDDNISFKNKHYCELTALYWIWKNDSKSEIVSIEHYRRFFCSNHLLPSIIKQDEMNTLFDHFDIITTRLFRTSISIGQVYTRTHSKEDLDLAEEAIRHYKPEYNDAFKRVILNDKCAMLNMMAMRKSLFDAYCEWLFPILEYVEKNNDMTGRDEYQQRAFGFLGERLLNVWLEKQEARIGRLNVYYLDQNKLISIIKTAYKRIPQTFKVE